MEFADHIAAVLVLTAALYAAWDGKRFQERLGRIAKEQNGRVKFYWSVLGWLWGVGAIVLGLWLYQGHSFALLGLRYESTWRFWLTSGVVAFIALFYVSYGFRLKSDAKLRQQTRAALEASKTDQLIPRTPAELRFWALLSLSTVSEEIVYRGFMLWYVAAFTNFITAAIVSVLLFAIGHSYQGMAGVIKTGTIGLIFLAVYWISGSLWPAIILHIVQDFFGGVAGYMCYSTREQTVSDQTVASR